jgi:hypothetical protein
MKVGYARVSTLEQSHDLQHDAFKKAGCKKSFPTMRRELVKALEFARKVDCLVVWRLDRLGRSLKHLIELIVRTARRRQGQGGPPDAGSCADPVLRRQNRLDPWLCCRSNLIVEGPREKWAGFKSFTGKIDTTTAGGPHNFSFVRWAG